MEDTPEDSTQDSTGCGVADGFNDGYRVRNLWTDMCMHSMRNGWTAKSAADVADECVDRYKAKFDVK